MSGRRSAAIVRNDLRILRSDPALQVMLTLMPLVVMAFFKPVFEGSRLLGHEGPATGAEQAVPGIAVMFSLFLAGSLAFQVFREHAWNTWERLRASAATSGEIVAGKAIVPLLIMMLQLTTLFVAGGLLYDLRISGSVAALALVMLAFALCLVGLGALLVSVFTTITQVNAATYPGTMVLAGLGGALTPVSGLPGWAQAVAPALPTYWAMRGFRSVILDGGGIPEIGAPVAVLLAWAGALLAVAAWRFRMEDSKVSYA